jgi:hypothetical protein
MPAVALGRNLLFPNSEATLFDEIVAARRKYRKFKHSRVILRYKELAYLEDPEAASSCKFSCRLFQKFYQRKRLSLRTGSSSKLFSLERSIRLCRGFHKFLWNLIRDETNCRKGHNDLDPIWGRFHEGHRLSKDEVPIHLGMMIIIYIYYYFYYYYNFMFLIYD